MPTTSPTDDGQIEFFYINEDRQFLMRQKCPVCDRLVYLDRTVHPLDGVSWLVHCQSEPSCIEVNSMPSRAQAFAQWNMVRLMIKPASPF